MPTLVLSARHSPDDQKLWRVAISQGWDVVRARGIRVPPIVGGDVAIYVEALYGPSIAEELGVRLLEPDEDWLVNVPSELRKRAVELVPYGEARRRQPPFFLKPPNDKSFAAKVIEQEGDLPSGVQDEDGVLIAEPVSWRSEYRCFCLDGLVQTLSPYLLDGELASKVDYAAPSEELEAAKAFCSEVLDATRDFTPRAIVIDVGTIADRGWAVVEANGAWGSGTYGCDATSVLRVVHAASQG